jgi:UDP-N-acetylmuramate dehydrogenase
MIVSVTLRLNKQPVFRVDYGQIKQELQEMGVDNLSVEAISEAVIRIRKSKLPDPAVIGNAGSFFKNPVIGFEQFDALKQQYPDLPSYTAEDGVKVPAAWLIEHAKPDGFSSWKGYREKNYGVHERQALCLVNYSDASGKDIFDLSTRILTSVQHTFNISLEREVNIW